MQVLIGADPEVFLCHGENIIGALGVVPGSKEVPFKTAHGWVQPDNMLAEFNIAPAGSRQEFIDNILAVMRDLSEYGQIRVQASHEFQFEELFACGEKAFEFGCDPDFSAWTGRPNPRPDPQAVGGLRTAGGHVHIGCDVAIQRPTDVIKACDVILGLGSLFFDDDVTRRSVYGKAGAYRPKKYGVEYRTLSNFWVRSPDLISWAYDRTVQAVQELDVAVQFANQHPDLIQQAINHSDMALATELMAMYEIQRAA